MAKTHKHLWENVASRHPYGRKCDLKCYFPSIDHGILTGEIARVVADCRVMDLIAKILASHRDGMRRVWGGVLSGEGEGSQW